MMEAARVIQTHHAGAVVLCEALEAVDRALWQKPQIGFNPHALYTDAQAVHMPLLIIDPAHLEDKNRSSPILQYQPLHIKPLTERPRSLLINIGANALPTFARFEKLLEIVPNQDYPPTAIFSKLSPILHAARERYRYYRNHSYALTHIGSGQSFAEAFAQWWQHE